MGGLTRPLPLVIPAPRVSPEPLVMPSREARAVNSKGTSEDSEAVSIDWRGPDDDNNGSGVPGHGTMAALIVLLCMLIMERRRREGVSSN